MRVLISYKENGFQRVLEEEFISYRDISEAVMRLEERGVEQITLTRLDLVCDFCSEPQVSWLYQLEPGKPIGNGHMDADGKWGACDVCHGFISDGSFTSQGMLAVRSLQNLIRFHPEMIDEPLECLAMLISVPHSYFWGNYDGSDPERVISDAELLKGDNA
jgi:hypothetical protein